MSDEPSTYRDVVEILEARIRKAAASGDPDALYAPGTKIPTHEELEDEFGLHRTTISRAIALLKEKKLLISRAPVGVFVAKVIPGVKRAAAKRTPPNLNNPFAT